MSYIRRITVMLAGLAGAALAFSQAAPHALAAPPPNLGGTKVVPASNPHRRHRRHPRLADRPDRGRGRAAHRRAGGDGRPDARRAAARDQTRHLSPDNSRRDTSGAGDHSLSLTNPQLPGHADRRQACSQTPTSPLSSPRGRQRDTLAQAAQQHLVRQPRELARAPRRAERAPAADDRFPKAQPPGVLPP